MKGIDLNKSSNPTYWRYITLGGVFALIALVIILRMVYYQFSDNALEIAEYYEQEIVLKKVEPERGLIYDRNGVLLAGNNTVYEVGLNFNYINPDRDAVDLAKVMNHFLGSDLNRVFDVAYKNLPQDEIDSLPILVEDIQFYVLEDYVSQTTVDLMQEYIQDYQFKRDPENSSLLGIEFVAQTARVYPEGELAGNVLGYYYREVNYGRFGVEGYYQDALQGLPTVISSTFNPNFADQMDELPTGSDLILTIDREMQSSMEALLAEGIEEYEAVSGVIMVMNPENGDILALASSPAIDPNHYEEFVGIFPYQAVGRPYEPGSVFKVFTVASGIDSGQVKKTDTFNDTNLVMGGANIVNWYPIPIGELTVTECLSYSSNVCLAKMGEAMGTDIFYDYLENFGFGQLTGIDMVGEIAGDVHSPSSAQWHPSTIYYNTFGQGISSTVMEMMRALSAFANDGQMVTPRIVKSMVYDREQYDLPIHYAGNPISEETADYMSQVLAASLEDEASDALVAGYRLAGKTGTAELFEDGQKSQYTNASFLGYGPVDDPQFMIYVWLEKPKASIWASETAAPLFHRVAQRVVVLIDLPPDEIRWAMMSEGN